MKHASAIDKRWTPAAALALAVSAGLLAGCATPIASSVVSANLAQEEAANKLLVLNIARAHEHMPMHFSQLGQIRSAPGMWGLGVPSLGLEIPFGGAADRIYTLTGGVEGQTPADVTAISNQEFMRGIAKPLTPDLMAHFVSLGWSKAMLMHLFFEAVEVTKDDVILKRLSNDPGSKGYPAFKEFVEAASACDLVFTTDDASPVPLSSPVAAVSIKEGIAAHAAKLSLQRVSPSGVVDGQNIDNNQHFRLVRETEDMVIDLRTTELAVKEGEQPCGVGAVLEPLASASPSRQSGVAATLRLSKLASMHAKTVALASGRQPDGKPDGKGGNPRLSFVMRSPQAIIYYLGQLSRAQNACWYAKQSPCLDPKPLTIPAPAGGRAALFRMTKTDDVKAAVTVAYAGHTFRVPRFDGDPSSPVQDQSVSVLSLMTLVMGLQDKGSEPPGVSNVRLFR
jgi:hypothetical protein